MHLYGTLLPYIICLHLKVQGTCKKRERIFEKRHDRGATKKAGTGKWNLLFHCDLGFIPQEEVSAITMNKYRKAQQSIEEAEHRADMVERSMTLRLSGGAGVSSYRSLSVSREMVSSKRAGRATSILWVSDVMMCKAFANFSRFKYYA